jgi:hypothetical protein
LSTSSSETLLDSLLTGMTVERLGVFLDRVPWEVATEVDAKA